MMKRKNRRSWAEDGDSDEEDADHDETDHEGDTADTHGHHDHWSIDYGWCNVDGCSK